MATTATRNGNTLYIEASGGASTIDALTSRNIIVSSVFLTSGAAIETLTLLDVTTTNIKLVLKSPVNTTTEFFVSDMEMLFPNGIRATLTQTDSFATIVVRETKA